MSSFRILNILLQNNLWYTTILYNYYYSMRHVQYSDLELKEPFLQFRDSLFVFIVSLLEFLQKKHPAGNLIALIRCQ